MNSIIKDMINDIYGGRALYNIQHSADGMSIINQILGKAPKDYRSVFIYKEAGFTFEEIGKMMEISTSTAYRYYHSCLERMAEIIDKEKIFTS